MPESDFEDVVTTGSPTEQVPIRDTSQVPIVTSTETGTETETELDSLFGDEADDWPAHGPKKGFRISWPVAALLVLVVASAGIWGGAYMQRHHTSSSSSLSTLFGSFRRGTGSGTGGSGSGGFAGAAASSNLTAGTVTDIIGDTLYVTTSSGSLVEVKVGSNATVDRNAKSTLSELRPGDTVTVTGTKSSNGSLVASTVSATQAGVTSGLGGLGFGGGGGGFGRFAGGEGG
jgi:hypothetical protein